jgi:hypothetical protein
MPPALLTAAREHVADADWRLRHANENSRAAIATVRAALMRAVRTIDRLEGCQMTPAEYRDDAIAALRRAAERLERSTALDDMAALDLIQKAGASCRHAVACLRLAHHKPRPAQDERRSDARTPGGGWETEHLEDRDLWRNGGGR